MFGVFAFFTHCWTSSSPALPSPPAAVIWQEPNEFPLYRFAKHQIIYANTQIEVVPSDGPSPGLHGTLCSCRNVLSFVISFAGFGLKEYWMVAQHNRLRSWVQPMAANMQKMVRGIYCLAPLCPPDAPIYEFAH